MILPIYLYGHPVLKKKAITVGQAYPGLHELIANMWETMYSASGVGLAAPQIGLPIRIFLVDTIQLMDKGKEEEGIRKVFINAQMEDESGAKWEYEEGCLSIPNIRGDVSRNSNLVIRYMDEEFTEHTDSFKGVNARVIQHEYDHTEGILFTELLKPVKKTLIRRKLENIRKGRVSVDYRVKLSR